MKSLTEYLTEVMNINKDVVFTTNDMINYEVWTPNDDLSPQETKTIYDAFYKKYPKDKHEYGDVIGCNVECRLIQSAIQFICHFGNMSYKERVKVVNEITDFLTNTVYSVKGGDKEIENMFNKIK